ncbi:hypothetical protein [Rosistilla ulvae]|uniref:hypothetical protein n=1 Tax=Rosistilla ulvae TaxID=1930277 RepID=UPI0011A81F3D|nr:hypothetical protein [Rosistilla ulvae]
MMYVLMLLLLFVLGLFYLLGSVGLLRADRHVLAILAASTDRVGALPRAAWSENSILWRNLPSDLESLGFCPSGCGACCADATPGKQSQRPLLRTLVFFMPRIFAAAELHSSHSSRPITPVDSTN